jgi:hypothetical protein
MKKMLRRAIDFTALSLPCLLLCLLAGCKTNPPIAAGLKDLQGHWEGGGAGSIKCSITIKGNSLHFYSRTDFWYETTFTLQAGTEPRQLRATIKHTAPSATNSIGQVVTAIFKIEQGTLTLAVNQDPEGPPPKVFPTELNGVIARYDLKKAQPQKKNAEASTFEKHPSEISKITSIGTMKVVARYDGKTFASCAE